MQSSWCQLTNPRSSYLALDLLFLLWSPLGEEFIRIGPLRDVGQELGGDIVLPRKRSYTTSNVLL